LAVATTRLYEDSNRRAQNIMEKQLASFREELIPQPTKKQLRKKVQITDPRPLHERYEDVLMKKQEKVDLKKRDQED